LSEQEELPRVVRGREQEEFYGPPAVRATIHDEATEFQRSFEDYVREHEIPPANVHIADETGMWTGSVPLRTQVDPVTMDAWVLRKADNRRDTGIVALSAGEIDADFLPHRR
jgi:hypothetical protein